jgi:hypothetical protein
VSKIVSVPPPWFVQLIVEFCGSVMVPIVSIPLPDHENVLLDPVEVEPAVAVADEEAVTVCVVVCVTIRAGGAGACLTTVCV